MPLVVGFDGLEEQIRKINPIIHICGKILIVGSYLIRTYSH
jgi:hypothetical protein